MRVMENVLETEGLSGMTEWLMNETGNTAFWLGIDDEMDEPSDAEDPEAALKKEVAGLRAEVADTRALVSAVQGALDCRSVLQDLERARMQLEDATAWRAYGAKPRAFPIRLRSSAAPIVLD